MSSDVLLGRRCWWQCGRSAGIGGDGWEAVTASQAADRAAVMGRRRNLPGWETWVQQNVVCHALGETERQDGSKVFKLHSRPGANTFTQDGEFRK